METILANRYFYTTKNKGYILTTLDYFISILRQFLRFSKSFVEGLATTIHIISFRIILLIILRNGQMINFILYEQWHTHKSKSGRQHQNRYSLAGRNHIAKGIEIIKRLLNKLKSANWKERVRGRKEGNWQIIVQE